MLAALGWHLLAVHMPHWAGGGTVASRRTGLEVDRLPGSPLWASRRLDAALGQLYVHIGKAKLGR